MGKVKRESKMIEQYLELFIPIDFPNMNQITDVGRYDTGNKHAMAAMKKKYTDMVRTVVRMMKLKRIEVFPVCVDCVWNIKNMNSDLDNKAAAIKFILDGIKDEKRLNFVGLVPNDNLRYVSRISHNWLLSAVPGVKLTITTDATRVKRDEPSKKVGYTNHSCCDGTGD